MSNAFETWVNSSECYEILRICARQVSNRAIRLGIVLDDAHIEAENKDDYLSAVASDLWQFLKGDAAKIAQQATTLLVSGDDDAFMAFVCQKFLDNCIEERRTISPFHNFYRRMRALLSGADGIRYETQARKGAYYSYATRADLEKLPDHLAGQDYGGWGACDVPFCNIHEKPSMLRLSRHFGDEALREFLEEYLLPIRELVRFVFAKYPLMLTVEYNDAIGEENEGAANVISLENRLVDYNATAAFDDAWKRQLPVIDIDIIDTQLDTLAQDCAAELTEQERIILCRRDCGVTLDVIAHELGMKAASNVDYHQKKAYAKLFSKWSLWGPPDTEYFGDIEEEQYLFYEKVIGFCKTADMCRDSRKGTDA